MAARPSEARTTIDSLTELLKEKGRTELGKAASTLGVDPAIVENWAKVLEQGGMVRITYEVGKMYIEPVTVTREAEQALRATVEAEKVSLETETAMQRAMLEKLDLQLANLGLSVKVAEKLFQDRFPELEKELEGVNKIYDALEAENEKINTIRKGAETSYEGINKKITALYSKIEGIDINTMQITRDQLTKIRDTLKKANSLEKQITTLSNSKDKAMDAIKKSVEDQLRALEKEIGRAEKNLDLQLKLYKDQIDQNLAAIREQAKGINDLSNQIADFRRDKEGIKKTLTSTRITFTDEYTKLYTQMQNSSSALSNEIRKMLQELNTLKSNFGEASKVYDSVQKAKFDVDQMTKRVAELKLEITKLQDELKDMETSKVSSETKAKATKRIKDRMKEIEDESNRMSSNANTTGRKVERGEF